MASPAVADTRVNLTSGVETDHCMTDRTTPNLPSRDLDRTAAFYAALGFEERSRNDGWMILARGPLEIEFFQWPALDPRTSIASCCVRVANVDGLHASFAGASLPDAGLPRLTAPIDQPWGWREFAVVDIDGNLLRCLGPIA
jgi:catechol 2,3-dioxygenase-like lactoylglutathione lyase family enzyme